MKERLQDTDFMLLRDFSKEVDHLRELPLTMEVKLAVAEIARPYAAKFLAKGYDLRTACDLLQDMYSQPKETV